MKVLSKSEYMEQKSGYLAQIKSGAIIIHPTDTIYGIGCNALLTRSVQKIRDLKKGPTSPFPIIAPSKDWIYEHCIIPKEAEEWIEKLPGPYTFVFKLKNPAFFTDAVTAGKDTIGVRIPNHWISNLVRELGYPLISTSVNERGRQFITKLDTLPAEFEVETDIFLNEGEKEGNRSQMIRFDE